MQVKKLFSSLAVVGVGLALLSGPAMANVSFFTPETVFHDDNLDYVYDTDNSGDLSVGDTLLSVFEFHDSEGLLSGQGPLGFSPDNMTGVAEVTIVAIVGGNYIFAATDSAAGSAFSGAVGTGILGAAGMAAGTAIAVYTDTTFPVNGTINANCGTRAACVAAAMNGPLFFTAGFFGDPDEAWAAAAALGGGTLSVVQGGNASTSFGSFNVALSIGVNNTGRGLDETVSCAPFCNPLAGAAGNGLVDLVANGQILGGQFLNSAEWTARSKTTAQVEPVPAPEPATLALLGLGLIGLAGSRMRKQA